ncbi:hypothetical protein [Thalassobacillus sp. C254]|uniref:pPIWI-associating nuclease domain-containing protein n=1 Tax=Thalassobacillus sp. C254 TaxID=1225341 RepID=UPI0006D0063D|nr:hypothetical protein [Thalassobacillus sp. C254]
MQYAIKGGLSDEFIQEELSYDFKDVTQQLKEVIGTLSKYTHINEEIYINSEKDGLEMAKSTLIAFDIFLKTIEEIRGEIISRIEEEIDTRVTEALVADVIQKIDILATHYFIESIMIESISIDCINCCDIHYDVKGSVNVELQYGSDIDNKKGNGFRVGTSYPFSLQLISDIDDPFEFALNASGINVDTTSFYE